MKSEPSSINKSLNFILKSDNSAQWRSITVHHYLCRKAKLENLFQNDKNGMNSPPPFIDGGISVWYKSAKGQKWDALSQSNDGGKSVQYKSEDMYPLFNNQNIFLNSLNSITTFLTKIQFRNQLNSQRLVLRATLY